MAIVVRNLTKTYNGQPAVNDISFDVRTGEILGFLGPNGAGKTTTLKMLAGLLYPTAGDAHVLGHVPWKRDDAYRRQFALLLGQKNQLWWDLPASESFELNARIYGISDADLQKRVGDMTELLHVKDKLARLPGVADIRLQQVPRTPDIRVNAVLPGAVAFKLYNTYGLALDEQEEMAREFFSQPVTLSVETIDNGPGEANGPARNGPNQNRANQVRREALNHDRPGTGVLGRFLHEAVERATDKGRVRGHWLDRSICSADPSMRR